MPLTKLQGYSILSNDIAPQSIKSIKQKSTHKMQPVETPKPIHITIKHTPPLKSKKKTPPPATKIGPDIFRLHTAIAIRNSLEQQTSHADFKTITKLTQNLSHNLSTYINEHYYANNPHIGVSNGYLKLWEILHTLDTDIFTHLPKETPTILHICEFPGNWIKCTYQYILLHHRILFPYTWHANSLNPAHPAIKKAFPGVLTDELGYLARHKSQWVFGADNTGDITKSTNITHIASKVGKAHLITGDAGLNKNYDNVLLQKLEIAQMLTCFAANAKGGSCIIKHFASSFHASPAEMFTNLSYTASIIATYSQYYSAVHIFKPVTSNPHSSEYYIIGTNFLGISSPTLAAYYKQLDSFTLNMLFEPGAHIPAIVDAIYGIYKLNAAHIESLNTMLANIKDNPANLKKKITHIRTTSIPSFNTWITTNNYISFIL